MSQIQSNVQNPAVKVRYDELDLYRLIAAICVVVIHLTASAIGQYQSHSTMQILVTAINSLALFAVPAFIGISALTIHMSQKNKPMNLVQFFKKRIAVLALPYMGWTLLYYFDLMYISKEPFNLLTYLNHLLLGTAFYHLYFMPIIFQFYLLYPLFKWLLNHIPALLLFVFSLVLFAGYTGDLAHWLGLNHFNFGLLKANVPHADRFFMSYLPFYTLGLWLAESYASLWSHKWLWLIVSLPLYAVSEYAHLTGRVYYFALQANAPFQMPLAWEISSLSFMVMLVFLTQLIRRTLGILPIIKQLSAYTFTLYLAHPLVLQICSLKLAGFAAHSLTAFYLLVLLLCIGLPLLGEHFYQKLKSTIKTKKLMAD